MQPERAHEFLSEHHHAVLTTYRTDGRPHVSPVVVALDGAGRVVLSTMENRTKTRNVRRDNRVTLCVFTEAFFGPWVQIDGSAEVVTPADGLDDVAVEGLHAPLAGEHPDRESFRQALSAEGRVVLRIKIEHAAGTA
jgi:PPOX class probable F420-dependent enzyme